MKPIEPPWQGSYEATWPDLARRLDAALGSRGVPAGLREEVIQETGARLWERWANVDPASDVFPLAVTIARNLVIDSAREHQRVELREQVETLTFEDPEALASTRMELRKVLGAVMSLTPRYRDLLLTEAGWVGAQHAESGGVVTNMARMRARKRLSAVLGRAGILVGLPYRRLKVLAARSGANVRQHLGNPLSLSTSEVAIACMLTVSGLVAVGSLGALDTDPELSSTPVTRMAPASSTAEFVGTGMIRDASALPVSRSRTSADTASSSQASPRRIVPQVPLNNVPHSKGQGVSRGGFGAWGYEDRTEGEMTVAGEDIAWKQRHSYRNPRCVRRALNEEVSTDCSGGKAPNGHVEVEAAGQKQRVDYGN